MENQPVQRQAAGPAHENAGFGTVQTKSAGNSVSPPAFQLKASSAPQGVVQARFDGEHSWLNGITDDQLSGKVGPTTFEVWKALRDKGIDIYIETGQPSFNFKNLTLSLPKEWTDSLKKYFSEDGTKDANISRALSGFTHELSHAHDRLIEKDSPKGKSEADDSKCIAVLKTELKAWWKEAKSAREHGRMEDRLPMGSENSDLVLSWLGVHFLIASGKNPLDADIYENNVIGRLELYFNKNKSKETTTTLSQLITDESTGLGAQIYSYAADIRSMFTSEDQTLRGHCASQMKTR